MPRYRFIGDPNDGFSGPDRMTWCGIEFSRDEWASVDDPAMAEKLDGNSHFECDDASDDADDTPAIAPKRRGRPPKVIA